MSENESLKFESLNKDVLRHLVLVFLDGPSACALLSTCKKMFALVTVSERVILRMRERDTAFYIRRARERIRICCYCFEPLGLCAGHQHRRTYRMSRCLGCSNIGFVWQYQPWLQVGKVFTLQCVSCKLEFSTRATSSDDLWMAARSCCLSDKCSGIRCNECSPLTRRCETCDTWIETFAEEEHNCAAFLPALDKGQTLSVEEEIQQRRIALASAAANSGRTHGGYIRMNYNARRYHKAYIRYRIGEDEEEGEPKPSSFSWYIWFFGE